MRTMSQFGPLRPSAALQQIPFAFDLTVSGALQGERTVPRLRADGMVSAHNSCLRSSI
jgi:hypothetical protein